MAENPPPAAQDSWLERVVDGRYRVLERIGHGGMGTVYKVVHTQIGKIAAMKVLHGTLATDKELIKRFHREAEAISRLSHPNIVQVFDFGQAAGSVYLVMEYLKGEDLGLILRRDGPIGVQRGAVMLVQICDALAEAHDLGIIHRDLKPENVRVWRTTDGQDFVKVLDFGLAKMIEEEKEASITAQGNLVGTPYYMAPEMIRGESLDHRCDLYSLGAMAYRMFTGENAFTAKTPVGVLTRHITDDVTLPSERAPERNIPRAVDAIVLRAMAKDRQERYQTALEMKHALLDLLELLPQAGPGVSSASLSGNYTARRESDQRVTPRGEAEDPALSPTGRIDDPDIPSAHPVLAKEDLAFERKLKTGRLGKLLVGLALLAGVAGGIYWLTRKGELYAPTAEAEPNNEPAKATSLASGKTLTGHLGQRVSATESDRDWYRLDVEGGGPQTLQARVSGISNMDLALELYDAAAGRVTGADSASKDGPEVITNWTLDPGRYFLLVREVWLVGVAPTENVTDAYRVTASWQPAGKDWELEPNDVPAKASPLAAGESLRGYLGAVDDVDVVKVSSGEGRLAGMVSGIAGADVVLEVTASGATAPVTVDEGGVGSGERFEVAADGKAPVLVAIHRKPTTKGAQGADPQGLDVPYTLKVWLQAARER